MRIQIKGTSHSTEDIPIVIPVTGDESLLHKIISSQLSLNGSI